MKKAAVLTTSLLSLALILGACSSNGNSSKGDSSAKTEKSSKVVKKSSSKEEKKSEYVEGNKIVTKKYDMEITSHKVIPVGQTGNEYGEKPVLAIWYKVHNISDKELDPSTAWIIITEAIQDNNKDQENKLEVGSLPDEKFLDSQSEKIKIGGTAEMAVAYELDDETTPVELHFNSTAGITDDFGKITMNLK